MFNVLIRWSIPLAALFIFGPIAWHFTHALHTDDGGGQTSLLLNSSISQAMLAAIIALVLALAIGVVGARYIEQRSGLLAAGFVLTWAACGMGRADRIIAHAQSPSVLYSLAIENAVLAIPAILIAFLILRVPTRVPMFIAASDATRDLAAKSHHEPTAIRDYSAIPALIFAAIGAGNGAWLIAPDSLKGQTLAAVAVGGILAAAAGRLASQRINPVVFFLGLMLIGIAGPILATFIHPSTIGPARAAIAGTLFPLARPMPFDWLAGGFVGIPFGLWWAGSLLEKHDPGTERR